MRTVWTCGNAAVPGTCAPYRGPLPPSLLTNGTWDVAYMDDLFPRQAVLNIVVYVNHLHGGAVVQPKDVAHPDRSSALHDLQDRSPAYLL